MRRMLSNRESARRSRERKQAHLNHLESQVSRLTSDNASLVKRLADMTQKYKDAALDNRNLIVDVETMRRKVRSSSHFHFFVFGHELLTASI
uniref:BZIP domain-containing protein n=1 Tax=Arundo donax TaxID=35708 RepID=A0A0A9H4J8_ARUDO